MILGLFALVFGLWFLIFNLNLRFQISPLPTAQNQKCDPANVPSARASH